MRCGLFADFSFHWAVGLSTTRQRPLRNERVTQIWENVAAVGKDWNVVLQGWMHMRAPPSERDIRIKVKWDIHIKAKCKSSHLGTVSQKCVGSNKQREENPSYGVY